MKKIVVNCSFLFLFLPCFSAGTQDYKRVITEFYRERRMSRGYHTRMLQRHRNFIIRSQSIIPLQIPKEICILQLQMKKLEDIGNKKP